jgi:hypothetical protein
MPSAIAARTVKNTVYEEERDTPPGAPEIDAEPASYNQSSDPDDGIATSGLIASLHQLLDTRARYVGMIPISIGEASLDCPRILGARKGVVARKSFDAHT